MQLEYRPPVYCPVGLRRIFVILHSEYYHILLGSVVLLHLWLAFHEPPPRLFGASAAELESADYWVPWKCIAADVIFVTIYIAHCIMEVAIEGVSVLKQNSSTFWLFIVVFLLFIDMILNVSANNLRPFRFLRPFVYTLTSPQQTMMMNCCMSQKKQKFSVLIYLFI
jgi:hypothetical protein